MSVIALICQKIDTGILAKDVAKNTPIIIQTDPTLDDKAIVKQIKLPRNFWYMGRRTNADTYATGFDYRRSPYGNLLFIPSYLNELDYHKNALHLSEWRASMNIKIVIDAKGVPATDINTMTGGTQRLIVPPLWNGELMGITQKLNLIEL